MPRAIRKYLDDVLNKLSHFKHDVYARGYSDLTIAFKLVLIISTMYHCVAHSFVLFNGLSIEAFGSTARNMYFPWDLMTSLAVFSLTRKNTWMVTIHALIHIAAVAHLFGIFPTQTYSDVFEMLEFKFENKNCGVISYYIFITTQDIATHSLNIYHLISTKNTLSFNYFTKI
eukprot:64280_1